MQLLPIVSAVGATGTQKSAATISMCQALSTPLSFWEFQRKNSNAKTSVVSPCKARISQILADGVIIDNLDKENNTAKVSCLSASNVSFTIKCSPIDTEALRDVTKTPKAGSGNVFLANDCLVALCPIEEGAELFVDAATLDAQLFMDLPEESRIKLVGFTEPSLRAYLSSEVKMPVQSVCPKLDVRRSEAIGEALRAISKVEVGETLYNFEKDKMSILPFATMYTICVSNGVHMLVDGGSQCLAHSCDPNTHIVIDDVAGSLKVVAVKEISPDDIVSFNYLTTEWDMDCAFECACGSDKCFGKIAGFRHLAKDKQDILLQDPKAFGLSPIVATLGKVQRSPGCKNPAIIYRSPENFPRGSILQVHVKEEASLAEAVGDSEANKYSPLNCLRRGSVVLPLVDLSAEFDAKKIFTKMFNRGANDDDVDRDCSVVPSLPNACLVNNSTIVSLRPIQKGETVFVRRFSGKATTTPDDLPLDRISPHIINVDVMQTFDGLPIATNKASQSERGGIPHYFIGNDDIYNVSTEKEENPKKSNNIHDFIQNTMKLIETLRKEDWSTNNRISLIVLCGGTLYYQLALLVKGISMIEDNDENVESSDDDDDDDDNDQNLKQDEEATAASKNHDEINFSKQQQQQQQREKLDWTLWNQLHALSPEAASRFHPNDIRRLKRQIQIHHQKQQSLKNKSKKSTGTDQDIEKKLTWRDFNAGINNTNNNDVASRTKSQPPILLWFHQGLNRRAFIAKLNDRVDKMVNLGLFEEAMSFTLKKMIMSQSTETNDDSYSVHPRKLLQKAITEFPNATTGVQSAIGFKEFIGVLCDFALQKEDFDQEWNKWKNNGKTFDDADHHHTETENAFLSLFDKNSPFVKFLVAGAKDDPKVISEGLDRMKTATWRYACQQDHWLRKRFLPLHRCDSSDETSSSSVLPKMSLILQGEGRMGLTKAVVATSSMIEMLVAKKDDGETENYVFDAVHVFKELIRQKEEASSFSSTSSSSSTKLDKNNLFINLPKLEDLSAENEEEQENNKKRVRVYRCEKCDKALVGDEQWKAHIATKAHKRNEKRVEPTAEQIEKWRREGEAKRRKRAEEQKQNP